MSLTLAQEWGHSAEEVTKFQLSIYISGNSQRRFKMLGVLVKWLSGAWVAELTELTVSKGSRPSTGVDQWPKARLEVKSWPKFLDMWKIPYKMLLRTYNARLHNICSLYIPSPMRAFLKVLSCERCTVPMVCLLFLYFLMGLVHESVFGCCSVA